MKKKLVQFAFFLFLAVPFLHAATKKYTDNENGYEVYMEVSFVGRNISQEDLLAYSSQISTWCDEIGHDTRKILKLTKELDWGLKKALADYELKQGETYIVRMVSAHEIHGVSFRFITALLTITDCNEETPFEFVDIYETYAELEDNKFNNSTDDGADNHSYSDSALGFKGEATAQYAGTDLSTKEFDNIAKTVFDYSDSEGSATVDVKTLTEEQKWLLKQALSKYNMKENETYIASIIPESIQSQVSRSAIVLIVTITDADLDSGDYSYTFVAKKIIVSAR